MNDVFFALAHPDRRALLDCLFRIDGRPLGELEKQLTTSRFAVMKHLRVLENANLIVTRRRGRLKLHYLNPVPIQHVSERWVSKYAATVSSAMIKIKTLAEEEVHMSSSTSDPRHVYEIYIRAPAQTVWSIITDDAKTPLYQHFNMSSQTDWRLGGAVVFAVDGAPMIVGQIEEFTPPSKLITTFSAQWSDEVKADKPSRVTWSIQELPGEVCKLTLVHDDFGGDTPTSRMVTAGWPETLSRLKTLVETGEAFQLAS